MARPYQVVERDANTGEVLGVRWDGTREECVRYLQCKADAPRRFGMGYTLELQHPNGRIASWWA